MLKYPMEVLDGSKLAKDTKWVELGRIRVLCPAYRPLFSAYKYHFSKLSDTKLHVPAKLIRYNNFVALTSLDSKAAFNIYLFPDGTSNEKIIKYLEKHQGWPKYLFPRIIAPISKFTTLREDLGEQLYSWENDHLPTSIITKRDVEWLVTREVSPFLKNINIDIVKSVNDTKVTYGMCNVLRSSGWFSHPNAINFHFKRINTKNDVPCYVVLHEIAHALDALIYRVMNHGPTFMIIYAELLKTYMDIDALPKMRQAGLIAEKVQ